MVGNRSRAGSERYRSAVQSYRRFWRRCSLLGDIKLKRPKSPNSAAYCYPLCKGVQCCLMARLQHQSADTDVNKQTDTVGIVMQRRPQDINARDPEGSTPLHLASQLGRTEIVMLLMSQSNIDDTVRNSQGRTALEVAKGSETARVLQGAPICPSAPDRSSRLTILCAVHQSREPNTAKPMLHCWLHMSTLQEVSRMAI